MIFTFLSHKLRFHDTENCAKPSKSRIHKKITEIKSRGRWFGCISHMKTVSSLRRISGCERLGAPVSLGFYYPGILLNCGQLKTAELSSLQMKTQHCAWTKEVKDLIQYNRPGDLPLSPVASCLVSFQSSTGDTVVPSEITCSILPPTGHSDN